MAGLGILALIGGWMIFSKLQDGSRRITFAQCEAAGGEAWRVDLYDEEICPACAEYEACRLENNEDAEACPQDSACSECMERNFPYPDKCPGGRQKIGEISDAAIWFQCCKFNR